MEPWELHRWHEEYLDACNRHDLDLIGGFLAPQVRRSGRPPGRDAWLRDLESLFAAFPDFRWRRVVLVAEDDRIAAHLRVSGTHRATWLDVPATGRHVHVAEYAFYRLDGGRIAEHSGAAEDRLVLEQLRD